MNHRARLLAFFRTRVATREDAEDLVHDVLLRAHQKRDTLDDDDRFESWLFAIARNALTDHYRRVARRRQPIEPDIAPNEDEGREEIAGCVTSLMGRLKDDDRDALERVDREGQTQVQVAKELGLSVSGMKSRVQRARRRLLDELLACCDVEVDARGRLVDLRARQCGNC